ncbi:hypothetical protein BTI_4927 [Burkholderia thailandensis MSMB121]|uniref:hypothetical protein n=1 Tax=Burkholderia humptydooensis TaxID=430531 RepID=UPI000327F407|nr:hypothetical protein [Burkholderia humptydooensis]AGK50672.1 hypothetical protein BTI_4927 [Burkholderia thailandensis MSMB121]ATF33601.1 hypothetical protein CO709_09990 [Burkholderia thailandensis]KST71676.1 hypothetical protein WS76_24355 [Burkholderia humptydooensis]
MKKHATRTYCLWLLVPALSGRQLMGHQYVRAVGAAELDSKYTINGTAYSAADILAAPDAGKGSVSNADISAWLGATAHFMRRHA